jgi:hypothetical protein
VAAQFWHSWIWPWAALPFALQGALILADEGFHLRRGLPAWERWGHPLDTFAAAGCYALALSAPPSPPALIAYGAACGLSCLCVTKDEWVHARRCSGAEAWLHACLFLLHPVLLASAGLWAFGGLLPGGSPGMRGSAAFGTFLAIQAGLTAAFGLWQIGFWNGPWGRARPVAAPEERVPMPAGPAFRAAAPEGREPARAGTGGPGTEAR